jgi:hypothetical protein
MGRGPTNERVPAKMLNNCGNSSREVFLKNLPTLVILGSLSSFLSLTQADNCSGVRYFRMLDSASAYMVLNLRTLISLPLRPILLSLKRTGPKEVSFTAKDKAKKIGLSKMMAKPEATRSKALLMKQYPLPPLMVMNSL